MPSQPNCEISYVGEDDSEYFRHVHGRVLNTMNPRYMLPVDDDEVKRSHLTHRMFKFLFEGKNYVGPVNEVLQSGQLRQVLDMGTGGGSWAIEVADEFPRAEISGVDLAPIQPRIVPPNCTFELCDLDQWILPYPDNHFDLIHARAMHTGIHNYPRFLFEISRLLRPGGLLIVIEPELETTVEHGMAGWLECWETYRNCLKKQGIDVTVPTRLAELIASTNAFEKITMQEGNIPIGFWPRDPHPLTIGQLAWMAYDLLLPALRPLFLSLELAESKATSLIENAQHDLYYPSAQIFARFHIVHAQKV